MNRRTVLRTTALALTAGLAGCSGGGGSDTDTDPDGGDTDTPTEAPTETPTGTPTETPTASAVGSPGTPTPTDRETATEPPETPTATEPPGTPTGTPTPTPTATPQQVAQVVDVAANNQLAFGPETFEVSVGDTVRWVWQLGGHNVRADTTPDGSDWRGTPGDDRFDAGYEYEHTFEVAGEYSYYCVPHRSAGMTGSFTVTE